MHTQLTSLLVAELVATTPTISLGIHAPQFLRINRPMAIFIVVGPEVAVEIRLRLACSST
jgi:hypothetical protein